MISYRRAVLVVNCDWCYEPAELPDQDSPLAVLPAGWVRRTLAGYAHPFHACPEHRTECLRGDVPPGAPRSVPRPGVGSPTP